MMRLRFLYALLPLAVAAAAQTTLDDGGMRLVRAAFIHADSEGLDPGRYAAPGQPVTATLLQYMRDLRTGRPEFQALDSDVQLPRPIFDAQATLTAALQQHEIGKMLADLPPPQPDYAALKAGLAHYRALAAKGGWPQLTADDAKQHPQMLLSRLAAEDGAPEANAGDAVKRFQTRNGLEADGKVGPKTLEALNVSAAARADAIAANMERWRWLPRAPEPDRIEINVPDAQLALWLDGRRVLTSRVVVGAPKSPTPILRAEGAGITINPPWNVPASIARREMLPKLKRDPAYLAKNDMILVNGPPGDPQGLHVDWKRIPAGTFPWRVRQYPGPKNSLGRIKIELPNKFDVYLHDTPAKSAFARNDRALSHGCVRVEQILPLASYAVAGNPLEVDRLMEKINAGKTEYVPLRKTLPVYFLYWTAFSGDGNGLQFRADLYGRDRRLIAAMKVPARQRLASVAAGCTKG